MLRFGAQPRRETLGGVPVSPWYLANAGPLRLVLEKARAEARDRWAKLTLPQRRQII